MHGLYRDDYCSLEKKYFLCLYPIIHEEWMTKKGVEIQFWVLR